MLVFVCMYWVGMYIILQCEIKFKATIIGNLCFCDNNESQFKNFSLKLNSNFQSSLYMPVCERDYAIESQTHKNMLPWSSSYFHIISSPLRSSRIASSLVALWKSANEQCFMKSEPIPIYTAIEINK